MCGAQERGPTGPKFNIAGVRIWLLSFPTFLMQKTPLAT